MPARPTIRTAVELEPEFYNKMRDTRLPMKTLLMRGIEASESIGIQETLRQKLIRTALERDQAQQRIQELEEYIKNHDLDLPDAATLLGQREQ